MGCDRLIVDEAVYYTDLLSTLSKHFFLCRFLAVFPSLLPAITSVFFETVISHYVTKKFHLPLTNRLHRLSSPVKLTSVRLSTAAASESGSLKGLVEMYAVQV